MFVPLKLVLVPATVTDPDDPLTCCTYDVGTAGTVYDAVRTDELDKPNEMPLLLANDRVPDVCVCVPAMMPLMPVCAPAMFGPEMVSDMPPALVEPESVMLFPPARTNWLETVPLVPDVLPPERPIETAGAPMLIVLPAEAMLIAPVPLIEEVAGTLCPDSARFRPLLLSVRLPEMFVPLKLVLVPATVTDPDDPLTCCT